MVICVPCQNTPELDGSRRTKKTIVKSSPMVMARTEKRNSPLEAMMASKHDARARPMSCQVNGPKWDRKTSLSMSPQEQKIVGFV